MSTEDRKESISLYGNQKEAMIVSHFPEKEKMVTLLSTMHLGKGTESPVPEKKSEVSTYYNATKGSIDTMEQMVRWFTSKKTGRRPMVIFYNMLDISSINAFIIWMYLNKENHAGKRGNRLPTN